MQERWDIEVLFRSRSMPGHKPFIYKGPQISIGSNPGVGGMQLPNPTIAPIHARIECYTGNKVMIHPIQHNEVRVATHEGEDWSRIDPIYKPVPLLPGVAVYIGPIGHGVLFVFLQAKTFAWKADALASVVNASDQIDISLSQNTKAKKIRIHKYPRWFYLTLFGMISVTSTIMFVQVLRFFQPEPPVLGPKFEGYDHEEKVDVDAPVEASVLAGLQAPFEDFVMRINADKMEDVGVRISGLSSNPKLWDQRLFNAVANQIKKTSSWTGFWKRLELVKDDYALVVDSLREAELPEVLAGVPFQETQYNAIRVSAVCAAGIWQFMPETGNRMGLKIKDCKMGLTGKMWSPTAKAPPFSVKRDSEYVTVNAKGEPSCRIGSYSKGSYCRVDDRVDTEASTIAAMTLMKETFDDAELSASGSVVQATILAHNAGYDDSKYLGKVKRSNVLPAYQRYVKKRNHGAHFYGDNLCHTDEPNCKSYLPKETQHYGYRVIAYHILAVCYYSKNYPTHKVFGKWKPYLEGYCKEVHAPDKAEL